MKISDIPKDQRPREKLLKKGSNNLSIEELLAIFIRIGAKNKSAIDLAKELVNKFGGLRGLYNADINSLLKIKGLGKAKIAQLFAVIELNKRYLEENLKERKFIENSNSIFDYLYLTMRDLDFELFKVIYLNGQNQILNIEDIFKGTITHSHIYTREIIKGALRNSATSIVCVHNHPSGDTTPSDADIDVTKKIKDSCELLGIVFQDHIIIGDNKFFSFKDKELL